MKYIYIFFIILFAFQAYSQPDSVYYHDSNFESQYGASGAYPAQDYLQMITRFTPPYYPAQLVGVRVWFRNAAQPSSYKVVVRADITGSANANNSTLAYMSPSGISNPSSGGTPDSAYSDYADLSAQNLIFTSGDVYAGVTQNLQVNGFVGFALDTNAAIPNSDRHWLSNSQAAPGSWWLFSSWAFIYANFGITAYFNPISTSMNTVAADNTIQVFPNPANEALTVSDLLLNRNTEVKILDSAGKLIYHNYFTGSIRINTTEWSNGLYLVKVRNKEIDSNLKVAVMH